MGLGFGRLAFLAAATLALGVGTAAAGDCPGNPDALGVSRTIVVDPRDHTKIGTMSYSETLPLADKEVVLTFDDGPIPPYTGKVLDILASECVKATYFIVGSMAREYPALVRRVYDDGHTVGTHSMSHPIPFVRQGVERTRQQIDDGITATEAALGEDRKLAPFFRFPGFGRTEPAETHLRERGLMAWGADVPADDWRKIGPNEVVKRGMRRLDAMGKGIILLHDIHQRTVEALPMLLQELKAGGYRVVHVVPATPERPATFTTADQWRMRGSPKPALPQIALADVQDLSGLFIADRSAAELCELKSPQRERQTARLHADKPDKAREAKPEPKVREAKLRETTVRETKLRDKSSEPKIAGIKVSGLGLFGIKLLDSGARDTNARGDSHDAGDEKKHHGKRAGKHADKKEKEKKTVAAGKTAAPDIHAIR